jgi:hypothetical protein
VTFRDQINLIVAAALLTAILAFLTTGCGYHHVPWQPTIRSLTYHITGSAPGPKEYDELDTFVSIEAFGKSNAYVFKQTPYAAYKLSDGKTTNYWDPTVIALVPEKDGTWTKFMSCDDGAQHLQCQGFVERSFMPRSLYVGERWDSYLYSGDENKPWIVLHHQASQGLHDHVTVSTEADYQGQMRQVKMVYTESFDSQGVLISQEVVDEHGRLMASAKLTGEGK